MDEIKQEKVKRKWSKRQRLFALFGGIFFFIFSVLLGLKIGGWHEHNYKYFSPDYQQINILPLLEKTDKTQEDYQILYAQTGLTKLGIDGLLQEGNAAKILDIQRYYFSDREIARDHFAPFTCQDEADELAPVAKLEDGDIIVTASIHVSWWRYGHAALVVDGNNGLILEAISPGSISTLGGVAAFANFANFIVLRPKFDTAFKQEVAQYAKENFLSVPYRLTVGVLSKKYTPDVLKYTQCAHLVWYAYKKFGVDLDSNGGVVVKPQDIANSPHVEVVQVVGFNPQTLWK